jgi:hypothetical protein
MIFGLNTGKTAAGCDNSRCFRPVDLPRLVQRNFKTDASGYDQRNVNRQPSLAHRRQRIAMKHSVGTAVAREKHLKK